MSDAEALVIGGGPAGIAAACTIAESNRSVLLCDQSYALGGAVHRSQIGGVKSVLPSRDLEQSWGGLKRRLERCSDKVEIRLGTVFVGLDATGIALLKNHKTNKTLGIRPRMAVFATGAYESVRPVPGWHLPGVMTAGGLQVSLKAAGIAPHQKFLLAGSGPLLLAVAAQMTKLGNPPVAVIERSNPLRRPAQAIGMPLGYLSEAASYLAVLTSHRVPWLREAEIRGITRHQDGLEATVDRRGKLLPFYADIVCLHNGLQKNNIGLPSVNLDRGAGALVEHAGDCRDLLGARAAPISGELAAKRLLSAADGAAPNAFSTLRIKGEERAQLIVSRMFQADAPAPLGDLPNETILCRCEQRTVGDLRRLLNVGEVSAKEIRLLGRFGMGRCQGRFCSKWAQALSCELGGTDDPAMNTARQRWPLRPISIGALADFEFEKDADATAR